MGEDNLEKNRSLEHATMQLCNLSNYATMQLEKLDIELTYENYATYATYATRL